MKNIKRMIALALSLAFVSTLSITSFAETTTEQLYDDPSTFGTGDEMPVFAKIDDSMLNVVVTYNDDLVFVGADDGGIWTWTPTGAASRPNAYMLLNRSTFSVDAYYDYSDVSDTDSVMPAVWSTDYSTDSGTPQTIGSVTSGNSRGDNNLSIPAGTQPSTNVTSNGHTKTKIGNVIITVEKTPVTPEP